jgi:hypothetical protein
MSANDSQQQLSQMNESYHNIADNQQSDEAHDMKNAMKDFIENISFQSQTSDDDSKQN